MEGPFDGVVAYFACCSLYISCCFTRCDSSRSAISNATKSGFLSRFIFTPSRTAIQRKANSNKQDPAFCCSAGRRKRTEVDDDDDEEEEDDDEDENEGWKEVEKEGNKVEGTNEGPTADENEDVEEKEGEAEGKAGNEEEDVDASEEEDEDALEN